MKTWKKYALGGLAVLVLDGALAIEGNDLKKKAEAIRRDYPTIAQLEKLEAERYILEIKLTNYTARVKDKKVAYDLNRNLNTVDKYKETLKNLEDITKVVNDNPELVSKLNDERWYERKRTEAMALPMVSICFGVFGIICAIGVAPFATIGIGMYYLGEYLDKKKKN